MRRILMLGILLYLIIPLKFLAADTDSDLMKVFHQANVAYKEGNFEEAIHRYEEIITAGWHSGEIYFNIGNGYYRSGDTGRAVLNFERARKLMPRDSDIKFNLRYAKLRQRDINAFDQYNIVERLMMNHVQFYTAVEMVYLMALLLVLMGGVTLGSLYGKWPSKWRRIILSLLTFILVIFITGYSMEQRYEKGRAVLIEGTSALFEPKPTATSHFKLPPGSEVKVLRHLGQWVKVQRPDRKEGWILEEKLEEI